MTQDEVAEWATENNLDVRPIQDNHYRLLDEYGVFVLDVYFKKNKKGRIIKNSVLQWSSQKWTTANSTSDLEILCRK